jgi:DcuC family C4-dicarboxylate transporter
MTLFLGALVIAGVIHAVRRGLDVRLVLSVAGLLLGVIAGAPAVVIRKFFATLAAEEFLIPICCAMGFAQMLRHTGCDQHLVRLLVNPLRSARAVLIPGAVVVGFIVNVPIISQTSAAAAMGTVLVPLMLASGFSAVTAGSALLLGASIGGELLNPGAPEFRTVVRETGALGIALAGADCVRAVLPLGLLHLGVAAACFWIISRRQEAAAPARTPEPSAIANAPPIDYAKALVPLVPLVLLFVLAPPFQLVKLSHDWLVGPREPSQLVRDAGQRLQDPRLAEAVASPFDSRLIGAAMVIGVVVAAVVDRRSAAEAAAQFFGGAGFAFTHIISIIVAAACFGEGVKLLGVDRMIGALTTAVPQLLVPIASVFPLSLAALSGSGMAATQSLFGLFAGPALALDIAPEHVGAVVSLSAAAGRTMSPVAAVTLMCASLTGARPAELSRRVALPLVAGVVAVTLAASLMTAAGLTSAGGSRARRAPEASRSLEADPGRPAPPRDRPKL